MPIALILIGLIMVVTGIKNTHGQFAAQLKSDFTGPGNFTYWIAAISVIGAVGYIKPFEKFANAFLFLVVLAFILKNGGVFDKFKEALDKGPKSNPSQAPPSIPEGSQGSAGTGNKSSSFDIGDAAKLAMLVI